MEKVAEDSSLLLKTKDRKESNTMQEGWAEEPWK